jgi:RNA polymerase sigma factor (sigma-70 family)
VPTSPLRLARAPAEEHGALLDDGSAAINFSCTLRLVCDDSTFENEERDLCARAKAGDRQALGEIMRRHGPRLYRSVLLPRLGRKAVAEEALSIVYTQIVERIDQFEWRDVGIYPWLRVMAYHVAIDQLRREKRERLFEPADLERTLEAARQESDKTSAELEREDLEYARLRVLSLLDRLSARYAKAIRMRVINGQSREHCAAAFSVTIATFDVLLHRALSALKLEISRDSEGSA